MNVGKTLFAQVMEFCAVEDVWSNHRTTQRRRGVRALGKHSCARTHRDDGEGVCLNLTAASRRRLGSASVSLCLGACPEALMIDL